MKDKISLALPQIWNLDMTLKQKDYLEEEKGKSRMGEKDKESKGKIWPIYSDVYKGVIIES